MKFFLKIIFSVFIYLIQIGCTVSSKSIRAETGAIAGIVHNDNNLNSHFKVNVQLLNSNIGCLTGENGKYIILDIPVGIYQVRASALNMHSVKYKNVRVASDSVTIINFKMTPDFLPIVIPTITWEEKYREIFDLNKFIIHGDLFDLEIK